MIACRPLAKPVPELNPEDKWSEILARQDVEVKRESSNESTLDTSVSVTGKELPLVKDAAGQEVSETKILQEKYIFQFGLNIFRFGCST